ncbi:MAG: hypothetical protein K6D59_09915 [Bacteroidales bacterium]|nr:hypothetical protein [Bacteroidales bacterium]
MIKYIKTFSIFTFILSSMPCLSQNQDRVDRYTTQINGKELVIHLSYDSTYEARSLWGSSQGFYDIIPDKKNPLYDRIIFGDLIYGTKNAFYFYYVSISQEVAKTLVDSNLYSKDSFYVAMCDLTGEFVPYYDVCFVDSIGNLLFCDYNEDDKKICSIPMGTSRIGMIGEQFNLATYFKSEYNRTQGSIAFVIGPSSDRFYIKKDRSCILYRPCYCDGYDSDCCVVFMKERREYQNGQ